MQTGNCPEWFAIQTKVGTEDTAVRTLATLDLETFLPLARQNGPEKTGQRRLRPLFPGYCFARFEPRLHLHSVRYSRGVSRVVGGEDTPWPVDPAIIEDIRNRLNERGYVELETRRFAPGEKVRICQGPLAGWTGVFSDELDDPMRVVILLQTVQQARIVADRDAVELAEMN